MQAAIEVGADAIHLVREDEARHAIAIGLTPHRLRLRLDTGDRVEQRHGAVEHAQRALDFDREVHVPRRIDDVDPILGTRRASRRMALAVTAPEARGRSGRDRDAALLLLLHPVHGGGAIMDLADLVALPGIEEDALGRRRLPGIDVRHDADVAVVLERSRSWHILQTVSSSLRRVASPHARRVELRSTKTRVDQAPLEQGPVSIRRRRVHSPLRREWGPKARRRISGREILRASPERGIACRSDGRQIVLRRLSGTASHACEAVGRYRALAGAPEWRSREPLRSPARSSPAVHRSGPRSRVE